MDAKRLNLLFIMADQMQAACLSVLGHPLVRTPNLDRLAAEGVTFTRHFAQTSPCGPSRASLLTGLYLMNHRSVQNGTPLDGRHTNVALEARRLGYDPLLFGYTDVSGDPRGVAEGDPSLASYEGVLPGMRAACLMSQYGLDWKAELRSRGYELPEGELGVYRGEETNDGPPRPLYPAELSDTAFLADQVLRRLASTDDTGLDAWFYHVTFLRPHPPLIAPDPYRRMYDPAAAPLPRRQASLAEEGGQHPYLAHLLRQVARPGYFTGHQTNLHEASEDEERELIATYYGLITEVDHHLGRIVDELKRSGDDERTLIVFTSDHGEMLGDHWLWGKEGYFDPAFHVPLIVRDPRPEADQTRGRRIAAFTESVDVMPTILDLLGGEVPGACDGASLRPFIEGSEPRRWRDAAHWEFDFRDPSTRLAERNLRLSSEECNYAAIRGERYKYVHFAALPPLLFDLEEDPLELQNLADHPDYRDLRRDCAERLLSWRMRHADRTLANTLLTPQGPVTRHDARP